MVTPGAPDGLSGDVVGVTAVDQEAGGATDAPSLEEVVKLLFELTDSLRQRFAARSADFDLSFAQAMALRELDGPLPMRDLAQRLCCDASNVTGIVDHLEAQGLVERRVAPADRRVKKLVLTDAGQKVRTEHRQSLIVDLPLVELTPDQRRQLADLLRLGIGSG